MGVDHQFIAPSHLHCAHYCNSCCARARIPRRARLTDGPCATVRVSFNPYARRMGQPTQRATNYTARSNIDTAQIFLHANGQRPKRAPIRQRSRRRQRRGEPHTEHTASESFSHSGIDEKRPTVKFVTLTVYVVLLLLKRSSIHVTKQKFWEVGHVTV